MDELERFMALREEMKRERAALEAKFPLNTGPEWLAADPGAASWVVAFEMRSHPSDVEVSGCLRVHQGTLTLDWAQRTGMFIGKPQLEQGSKTILAAGIEEACAAAWAATLAGRNGLVALTLRLAGLICGRARVNTSA